MKLLSLFSGIGAFECALKRCGIPFELAAFCECDKHASEAYSLIHGEPADKNLGDIRSAACSRFFGVDCVCYGFPCQDISVAGHQRGFSHNGARTRSGLFFEAARIIRECWRLQGFTDAEFERAKNGGISNTQLYKMAGNSIAVPVLCAIFEKLRRYFD